MNYVQALNALIDKFLDRSISLAEFQQRYSDLFVDEIPDEGLPKALWEAYGEIHEKAEWTTADPPPADRKDGWLDGEEFRQWLIRQREGLARLG